MSYQVIPGRCRALCCVCGTCRTYSPVRSPRRHVPEGYSAAWLEQHPDSFPDYYKPWHRVLGDLKCAACGKITQHALLRDDDAGHEEWRNHAERVNYGLARGMGTAV